MLRSHTFDFDQLFQLLYERNLFFMMCIKEIFRLRRKCIQSEKNICMLSVRQRHRQAATLGQMAKGTRQGVSISRTWSFKHYHLYQLYSILRLTNVAFL